MLTSTTYKSTVSTGSSTGLTVSSTALGPDLIVSSKITAALALLVSSDLIYIASVA